MFFDNCGIDDREMADILEGLSHIKDFKSLVTRMNYFNGLSIAKLEALLLKRLPNHLEEIRLIDCHMSAFHISEMIQLLMDKDS